MRRETATFHECIKKLSLFFIQNINIIIYFWKEEKKPATFTCNLNNFYSGLIKTLEIFPEARLE